MVCVAVWWDVVVMGRGARLGLLTFSAFAPTSLKSVQTQP